MILNKFCIFFFFNIYSTDEVNFSTPQNTTSAKDTTSTLGKMPENGLVSFVVPDNYQEKDPVDKVSSTQEFSSNTCIKTNEEESTEKSLFPKSNTDVCIPIGELFFSKNSTQTPIKIFHINDLSYDLDSSKDTLSEFSRSITKSSSSSKSQDEENKKKIPLIISHSTLSL